MTSNDPITAALDQLAAHHEQITQLDTREAGHYAAVTGRLTELTDLAAGIGRTLEDHAAAVARLTGPSPADADPDGYQPGPAPAWWKLTAADRQEPVARLQRLGGAGVPARLRAPGRHARPLLGPPTTCACTAWTSWPTCGPCSTSSPAAPRGCCRPRPNTRPASCPP